MQNFNPKKTNEPIWGPINRNFSPANKIESNHNIDCAQKPNFSL